MSGAFLGARLGWIYLQADKLPDNKDLFTEAYLP